MTICNSSFNNNIIKSNYSIGGVIYNYEAHNVYVINSTFDNNRIDGKYALGSAIANSAVLLEWLTPHSQITSQTAQLQKIQQSSALTASTI